MSNITQIIENVRSFEKTGVFSVTCNLSENKIIYNTSQDVPNVIVSVKDIDSKTVLYSVKHEVLASGINFWVVPVSKEAVDFESDKFFGGVSVEIYSQEKLIYVKEFRMRYIEAEKPILPTVNHTSPSYGNYMEFFVHKIHDKYISEKEFDVVVDVGANVGIWTEYVSRVSKCKKIYMIEPNSEVLSILKNTYKNGEFEIIDSALAPFDGELDLFVDRENSIYSSTKKTLTNLSTSYRVNAITLNTFIKKYNIDKINLLKIDIESGEYDLFEKIEKQDLNKIDNILLEYHLFLGKSMDDVKAIMNILSDFGFKCILQEENSFLFATK